MKSLKSFEHLNRTFDFYLAQASEAPAITALLNSSYKELADRGWNYTATYQDVALTLEQMADRRVFVLKEAGEIVATFSLREENHFTQRRTLYVGKFAVRNELKKLGLGSKMIDFARELAVQENFEGLQLDTAKPATHLVQWYQKLGFAIVGAIQFQDKVYESWVFEKPI
jgi:ribosomal protein S18 acetylase RimI-like enzyme